MERTEVLDTMSGLKLYGMRSAYDETLAAAVKRKHEPQRFVGDLLKAEISEKQARSIKYQLTVAKLPLARDVEDFAFKETPINEALVRDLAGGAFIFASPKTLGHSQKARLVVTTIEVRS
jgi:IstB-like ATP binding protein